MSNINKMVEEGYYGTVIVEKKTFDKLNNDFFISNSTDQERYMCANLEETEHLISLGVEIKDITCDWFRICLLNPKQENSDV